MFVKWTVIKLISTVKPVIWQWLQAHRIVGLYVWSPVHSYFAENRKMRAKLRKWNWNKKPNWDGKLTEFRYLPIIYNRLSEVIMPFDSIRRCDTTRIDSNRFSDLCTAGRRRVALDWFNMKPEAVVYTIPARFVAVVRFKCTRRGGSTRACHYGRAIVDGLAGNGLADVID